MKRALILGLVILSGCAIRPAGEDEERAKAQAVGKPYEERNLPTLVKDASWQDVLRYAILANGELEQRYWEWRSALEMIPQDASPGTSPTISYGAMFENGATSWNRQSIGLGSDPMNNIPWPGKLAAAGERALEMARAAGFRFERAKFDLQARVLSAYYDLALQAELIRLQEADVTLLETIDELAEARSRAGAVPQQDLLKTRTARDLARNQLQNLQAQLPGRLASLNALLNRPADSALSPKLPKPRVNAYTDEQLIALVAERNPELRALAHEIQARKDGVRLAQMQFIPDFGLNAVTSLDGMVQNLMAMITAPFVRFEAIRGAIEQAKAQASAMRAMRRHVESDLRARILTDLYLLRNADRQITLFRETIVPRAEEVVTRARAAYTAGQVPLVELLDSQRMLIEVRTMLARLQVEREKLLAEVESVAAVDIEKR